MGAAPVPPSGGAGADSSLSGPVGRPGGMDTAPAEQLPPPTVDDQGNPVCCGEGGAWTPKPGEPLIPSCLLCPRSATYRKRPKG